jgi:hypothetical protein
MKEQFPIHNNGGISHKHTILPFTFIPAIFTMIALPEISNLFINSIYGDIAETIFKLLQTHVTGGLDHLLHSHIHVTHPWGFGHSFHHCLTSVFELCGYSHWWQ